MSNAARSFGRTILVALTVFGPALLLGGCGSSSNEQMAEQVAVAKEAADRAVKAQQAAEEAAKAIIAKAPPGTFGEDTSEDFADSGSFESSDPIDSAEGEDTSGDGESAGSTSSVPR